ncbi:MAG: pseudouridine synthase [Planctomycetota bacterium]|jgi:23S rRNA pseudouridine2605 synthase
MGGARQRRRGTSNRSALKVTPLPAELPEDGKVRLNRFLASAGVCSRRAADELIEQGRVTVNGEIVSTVGSRVDASSDDVRFDGSRVQPEKKLYLLFNKPRGVVCTNAKNEQRRRVIDYLPEVRGRVYTVGRLDADSEGLILLTNDGDFAQRIAHPSHGVPKTYAVLVKGRVGKAETDKARGGVWLSEGKTGGARIIIQRLSRDRSYLKVILREGRNREIRRIFAKLGYPVVSLKRVRIGELSLHGLGSGRYRFLTQEEVRQLADTSVKGNS